MNNQARRESTVGEVINLMSVDAEHIQRMLEYVWALWSSPLQIGVSLYLLYATLGPPMFAGLGLLVLLIPVNGLIMAKMGGYMTSIMTQKDRRMKLINEVLNGMKVGWGQGLWGGGYMTQKDRRMKLVNEVLNGMKVGLVG